jgi:SRSO17 transposase
MDADTIRRLEPQLLEYVQQFRDCFSRSSTWRHVPDYIRGQLAELPRKSVEPIALDVDKPVRTLQHFLTDLV